jgi:lysophospholipase L1-like esterase
MSVVAALAAASLLVAACASGSADETADTARKTSTTDEVTTTSVAPTTAAPTTAAPTTTTTTPPNEVAQAEDDAAAIALEFIGAIQNEDVRAACSRNQLLTKVDHPGATMRVGIIGDSLTVQIVDRLVADTRFNWSISAVCGARAEHYLGNRAIGQNVNLRPGLDSVLLDQPDVVIIALGSNEVLQEVYDNVPRDLAPGMDGLLRATDSFRCRTWINVHTSRLGTSPSGPEARWAHYAPHYNQTLNAFAAPIWMEVGAWDYFVAVGPPERLLTADGVHLNEEGKAVRLNFLLDTALRLANDCVLAPPPTTTTTTVPLPPPTAPTTTR